METLSKTRTPLALAVSAKFGKINWCYSTSPFFGFLLAPKVAVTKLANIVWCFLPIFRILYFAKLFCNLTVQSIFRNRRGFLGSLIFGFSVFRLELKNWQENLMHASFPPAA